MSTEKTSIDIEEKDEEQGNETSNRARNRTVMLTPDITGQVRAMLAGDSGANSRSFSRGDLSPVDSSSVFSTYSPASSSGEDQFKSPISSSSSSFEPKVEVKPSRSGQSQVVVGQVSPIVGFLVSFDVNPNGEVFELRSGRWIISCERTSSGNYILLDDDSVSPLHAIMRVSGTGEIQVLDQLSEHGTGIRRFGIEEEELLTGSMSSIEHGDMVRFGNRMFHVCVIAGASR